MHVHPVHVTTFPGNRDSAVPSFRLHVVFLLVPFLCLLYLCFLWGEFLYRCVLEARPRAVMFARSSGKTNIEPVFFANCFSGGFDDLLFWR